MWEPQGIYSKFILKQPTLLFDSDAIMGLRNYPYSRVAVIHGKGLTAELKNRLEKSITAFELKYITKSWTGEPVLTEMRPTIAQLEQFRPDMIIALGGGSVLDGAKIARLYYEFPFFDAARPQFLNLEWKTCLVAIPTTVGSGAEISSAAVILDIENKRKEMIVSHSLLPDIIVFDPNCIKGSPERMILLSALDAVAHIVEGYVSVFDNGFADFYAEKGLQNIHHILSKNPDLSLSDFSGLQFAGYLGGIVQNHCLVGAAHAIAHQLAGYGFAHAEAVSLVLPEVILANCCDEKVKEKYEKLCSESGFKDIDELLLFITSIVQRIGLSEKKAEMQILLHSLNNDLSFLKNIQGDKGGKGNPVSLTDDFVKTILNMLLS